MTCAACVGRAERILKAQTGVLDAAVNLATQTASVTFLDGTIAPEDLAQVVTAAGYETTASQGDDAHNDRKEQEERTLNHATLITGLPALLRGAPDMNSLVALGTLAAWIFSTLALFTPVIFPEGTAAVYFEAAGIIVTLILLGRLLEARAKGRTGAAIKRLIGYSQRLLWWNAAARSSNCRCQTSETGTSCICAPARGLRRMEPSLVVRLSSTKA
jgi:cation transport ATPase